MTDKKRTYSESEIRFLIQRATTLRENSKPSSEELSLAEIEQIAEDLGLSRDDIRSAALELEIDNSRSGKSKFPFGRYLVDHSRVVNRKINDEQWERILLNVRDSMGVDGKTEKLSGTYLWKHSFGDGDGGVNFTKTRMTVRPEGEHTSVQIEKHFGGAAIPILILVTVLSIAASLLILEGIEEIGLSAIANWIVFLTVVAGSIGLTQAMIGSWSKGQLAKLKRIVSTVEQTLSESGAEDDSISQYNSAALTESETENKSENYDRIDLPDEQVDAGESSTSTSGRTRSSG